MEEGVEVVNRKKAVSLFLIFFIMVPMLLTSCFDKKEINERAFINAIYIEKNNTVKPSEMIASNLKERDNEDLVVTYGIANTIEGEDGGKAFTSSITGTTLGDATEKLNSETTKTPFFGHTKLIVLGKGILEDSKNLGVILDDLERNVLIDREIKVIATDNSSVNLEKLRPETEDLYSSYVTGVMDSADSIAYTLTMNLGDFFKNLREGKGKSILPIVRVDNGSIKIDRAAFISDYKLKDVVSARQVRGYKLFKAEAGNIREYVQIDNVITTFKLSSIKRKINYIKGGSVPKFHINYSFEGGIESYDFKKQVFNVEKEAELEKKVKKLIETQLMETADYFQNKVGIDYLGLDDFTHKFHPNEYKKYKNWDEAFKKAEISYDVNVNILRFGDSK